MYAKTRIHIKQHLQCWTHGDMVHLSLEELFDTRTLESQCLKAGFPCIQIPTAQQIL